MDVKLKHLESIPAYRGPHAIEGIRFRPAGSALGVSAWGMNVLEIDAGCTHYPEHDHAGDGQEEVYVVLRGSARLRVGDHETELVEGDLVRVGPDTVRKILPGDRGVTVLALGGTPGKVFESSLG
ncbi:MAG: cupin domain-containing protein [Myxococcales bacterium]|nr:cupin domain-containing protein [Myxococcales bacterium]